MDWVLGVGGVVVAGAAAIWIRDSIEGDALIHDFLDARRIARADVRALDAFCAANRRRSDVLVSLTTIPSRLPYLEDTLKSLLRQTVAPAEIRLNIPDFSRRENTSYVIPEWLTQLRCVTIARCADFGPATKFIPALLAEPPDRRILVVDDDRIYPEALVEDLDAAARREPGVAFGTCGWVVPADMTDRVTNFSNLSRRPPAPVMSTTLRRPYEVDILKGVSGYIVRPRFFDRTQLTDYSAAPPEAFYVDDIWLSGLCRVPKFVIPTRYTNFHPRNRSGLYRATSLGREDADKRKNTVVLRYFGPECWRVGGPLRGERPR